ncbi:MAG: hypothetical protein IJP54_07245 [Synergistaceae bacterium]|nr:hypothetical protein [Synergistaceae bacterium]MBR0035456.1 hypothetical protein [Synergistaceae bacterium]
MTDIEKYAHVGTEKLAQELHESQREYAARMPFMFKNWEDLSDYAREGYLMQARYLQEMYHIIPKLDGEGE